MRSYLKRGLASLRLDRVIRPLYGGRGAVLMFHRLRPRDPSLHFPQAYMSDVDPADFHRLLDAFEADGIEVVSLDEAGRRLGTGTARRFVCLTFDDGYRDNLDALLPIAEARRVPATVYVTTGFVDRTAAMWWYALDGLLYRESELRLSALGPDPIPARDDAEKAAAFNAVHDRLLASGLSGRAAILDELADRYAVDFPRLADRHAMDWGMLRRLAGSELVEIGAHTVSHPALAALEEDEARREMADSRAQLEAEIGRPVRHFAFPYGTPLTTGAREVRLAQDLGFATAVTTRQGALFPRHADLPHAWPRFGVGPDDGPAAMRLRISGLGVALRHPLRPVVTDPV